MTVQQLKRFQEASPFEPFAIHLADGRWFPVMHPELAILSSSGRTVSIVNSDEMIEVVDMLLVTSLRPLSSNERRVHSRRLR